MSAKKSDDGRVAEMYRIILETETRISEMKISEASFLNDDSVKGRNAADGIFMCFFRVTEEARNISDETKLEHPEIPWRSIYGMRNIFAHDYGKLDRRVIWTAVTEDFRSLKAFCLAYAVEHDLDLNEIIDSYR